MAATQHRQLSRLQIPPNAGQQQQFIFNENAPMFSPSLPTAIQVGMPHPYAGPFPGQQPLQTPMQSAFFPPQPPGAPARPSMHRQHPSVALAAAGILPPPGMPMTPLGQMGFPAAMLPPPFVPRSKRTQSVSTGGPPKAVLGGPQRKVSPMPVIMATATVQTTKPKKKIVVQLPKECPPEGAEDEARPSFARIPLPIAEVPEQPEVKPPEVSTCEPYPPDGWRHHIPPTVDVFLPGKGAWDTMKKKLIEEKLEKLGIERGFSAPPPHIHAPHARAASISSPADPALLMFKLNKLQQSQNASTNGSLAASPQPPANLSPSPGIAVPPRFQGRHGHSMSLSPYNPTAAFNPFGPAAVLGSDQIFDRSSLGASTSTTTADGILHAPQGRIPASVSSLAPPPSNSRPESRPDFTRGFGLDSHEEEEEPPEGEDAPAEPEIANLDEVDEEGNVELELNEEQEVDGESTVAQSRIHSRHVSKVSAPLSLRSVGGSSNLVSLVGSPMSEVPTAREHAPAVAIEELDHDAVAEWTGSEDFRDESDDESIGEWSNPSDEERARQDRVHRRMMRHAEHIRRSLEAPRRLPNFPRPPESGSFVHLDDDVISNPSEEGDRHVQEQYMGYERYAQQSRPASNHSGRGGRPLPAIPHSRTSSAHFSYHDPALAHSRETSDQFNNLATMGASNVPMPMPMTMPVPVPMPTAPRTETLNPLAKPFVFGTSFAGPAMPAPAPIQEAPSHPRTPSLGKVLNVAAPEFKPTGFVPPPSASGFAPGGFASGGFTFQAPPGVPHLDFQVAAAPRPLPTPPVPVPHSPVRASQGREKRQRRASDESLEEMELSDDQEGNDTMLSFKFPPMPGDSVVLTRHSAPTSPPSGGNALAKASATSLPDLHEGHILEDDPIQNDARAAERNVLGEGEVAEPESALELPFPPSASKPKRAPHPLDFKHPVSHNTVPAGLFKALVSNDHEERTRRTVRSRLSSRDVFDFDHSPRPSLDDLAVPSISQRKVRARVFTEPTERSPRERDEEEDEEDDDEHEDLFSLHKRSSLPTRHVVRTSGDEDSELGLDMAEWERRTELHLQEYEERMEALLDEKLGALKSVLEAAKETKESKPDEDTESTLPRIVTPPAAPVTVPDALISEIMGLLRAQMRPLTPLLPRKELPKDADPDAEADFDFEALKDILEQTQAESRSVLRRDLEDFLLSHDTSKDFKKFAEELSERTVKSVVSTTSQLTMHLHTMEKTRGSFAAERETIARDIVTLLTPALASMRPEPIDYEGLTAQLTQAVKPHITQLIDLAADKRETAGLIVDRLVPILPSLYPPQPVIDMDGVTGHLLSEVRKIIGPLDAHEIKEQVSDLVVERLDSRLAVRDRAFNVDAIVEKVKDAVGGLLVPVAHLKESVDALADRPAPVASTEPSAALQDTLASFNDVSSRLTAAVDALTEARLELQAHPSTSTSASEDSALTREIEQLQDILDGVADDQKRLVAQNSEFSDFCQDIVKHIDALPETLVQAAKVLQHAHADFQARDTSQKDQEEIRRLMNVNADLQVQLAKARGAHGQVRVEKDTFADRLRHTEGERDALRARVEELEAVGPVKSDEEQARRTLELEAALADALERIKSSDVLAQRREERIASLESAVSESSTEKQLLKTKVDKLELDAAFAQREKAAVLDELALLKQQNEELALQQTHWDEMRSTSEQLQTLVALMQHSTSEEAQEAKRVRSRLSMLEAEHASLQRRAKELEAKAASSERTAVAARQSLVQAQQRATEWERRAGEAEGELKAVRERMEGMEDAQRAMEEEQAVVRMQLEERDAEERLAKDRESKLRDQIAALEGQMARVQAEADGVKKTTTTTTSAPTSRVTGLRQNGYAPSRPESRSTVFVDSRVPTPTGPLNVANVRMSGKASPPQESVWNSIHAPTARRGGEEPIRLPMTPKAAPRSHAMGMGRDVHSRVGYSRPPIASPTPSNVSAAPTLGDDGWWS